MEPSSERTSVKHAQCAETRVRSTTPSKILVVGESCTDDSKVDSFNVKTELVLSTVRQSPEEYGTAFTSEVSLTADGEALEVEL